MSSTTSTRTVYTAKRLRSSGATREQALDSLTEAGASEAEAETVVDDIDLKLGLAGRTLPEDASRSIREQVAEHLDVLRTAAPQDVQQLRPRFESRPAPTSSFASAPASAAKSSTSAQHAVPTLGELAQGQAAGRPRYELVEPTAVSTDTDETPERVELTVTEKSRLRTEANRRAMVMSSQERLTAWLVREGMSEPEAIGASRVAWDRAVSRRRQETSNQRGDQTVAWLEIFGGVGLLLAGLAAGWFVGFFLFIIIDGFRRLGAS